MYGAVRSVVPLKWVAQVIGLTGCYALSTAQDADSDAPGSEGLPVTFDVSRARIFAEKALAVDWCALHKDFEPREVEVPGARRIL